MTANGWLQIFVLLLVVFLTTKPLGGFMARVFDRERTWLDPVMRPVERILYKLTGVDENHEMDWKEYALALLLFSGVSMILLYVLQRVQQWALLPWNPQKLPGVPPARPLIPQLRLRRIRIGRITVRDHHELSDRNGGPAYHNWVSATRAWRWRSRSSVASRGANEDYRQLLGRHGPRHLVDLVPLC